MQFNVSLEQKCRGRKCREAVGNVYLTGTTASTDEPQLAIYSTIEVSRSRLQYSVILARWF